MKRTELHELIVGELYAQQDALRDLTRHLTDTPGYAHLTLTQAEEGINKAVVRLMNARALLQDYIRDRGDIATDSAYPFLGRFDR